MLRTIAGLVLLLTASVAQAEPLPPATFHDGKGGTVSLPTLQGKPVLLVYWATWCVPCRVEMPALDRLAKRHPDLTVLPVSIDRMGRPAVETFYGQNGIVNLPILLDDERSSIELMKVKGVPVALLYDRQGRQVKRIEGKVDWDAEDALIRSVTQP